MYLAALQGHISSSVSYMIPSCSGQVGVTGGLACLPHLVVRPPNLKQSSSTMVQHNLACLQRQVVTIATQRQSQ